MIGAVLKALAYYKAPKVTFAVLHPKKAAVLKKMQWDLGHAPAPRLTAVGAAAVALPVGLLLGRMGQRTEGPRRNPVRRPLDPAGGILETDIDLDEDELV